MSARRRHHLVLLTATVIPKPGQAHLAIHDPQVRLEDYRRALQHYQQQLARGVIDGVVFVENSGFALAGLAAQFTDPAIEWIALAPMDYAPGWHRGYGEFRMIDHVMRESVLVRAAAADTLIWKITGRYRVRNLARLLAWAPARTTLYGQLSAQWCELSVIAWTRAAYWRALGDCLPLLASPQAPELVLAKRYPLIRRAEAGLVSRFVWPPWLDGRRATSGTAYRGRLAWLRHLVEVGRGLCGWRPHRFRPAHTPDTS